MKDYIVNIRQDTDKEGVDKPAQRKTGLPPFIRAFFMIGIIFLLAVIIYRLPPFFKAPPQSLVINGIDTLDQDTIVRYLEMKKDTRWIDLDPYQLSLNLKRHPWIDKAVVHRTFPLSIRVDITERVPIAQLRTANEMVLLGKDYMVLKSVPRDRHWDLPIIVNRRLQNLEDGDIIQRSQLGKAFQLIEILRGHPVLNLDSVSEIDVTDPYNIELITIPYGIEVKLGFDQFERKLATLYRILPDLTEIKDNIRYIDLRYVRGGVVKKKR